MFFYGSFKHKLGAECACTEFSGNLLLVSVASGKVHYRGYTASILCIESTGINIRITQNVIVKYGEKAYGVKRIVNHHSIQKYFVLNWGTAPDIQLSSLVTCKNHARKYLKVLRQVGLAANGWYSAYLLGSELYNRCAGVASGFFSGSRNLYSVQIVRCFVEKKFFGDYRIALYGHLFAQRVIAKISNHQGVITIRNAADGKISVHIGCCTVRGFV